MAWEPLDYVLARVAAAEGDPDGLPDNHVITVAERRVSVDVKELIQNNIATDTYTLELDSEWEGVTPVVIFGDDPGVRSVYQNGPTEIPAVIMAEVGSVSLSVTGYDSSGEVRLVTVAAPSMFNVVKSGLYIGDDPPAEGETLLGQLVSAAGSAIESSKKADASAELADTAATAANTAASAANTAAGKADTAATKATDAATKATDAAGDATRAAQSANAAAEAAGAAAEAARGNVLKGTLGPAPLLSAYDAYATKPRKLTVFGNTRQNLWVNPATATKNGVTFTANADGSVTVSGTSTASVTTYFTVSHRIYALKPETTYTLSVDKTIAGIYAVVREDDSSGSAITSHSVQSDALTFQTKANMASCTLYVSVVAGSTVSGTYRIMLNEGSEPEPWCPPGLNGVEELSIVTAGKNLYGGGDVSSFSYALIDVYSWLRRLFVGKKVRVSFDLLTENGGTWLIYACQGSGLSITFDPSEIDFDYIIPFKTDGGSVAHFSATGTVFYKPVDGMTPGQIMIYKNGSERGSVSVSNIQIEFGEEETAYEPPAVTSTPVDLDGHALNSLPAGTRDELRVDGTGAVTLVQRTQTVKLGGGKKWARYESPFVHYQSNWNAYGGEPTGDQFANMLCDKLPVSNTIQNGLYSANLGGVTAFLREPTFADDAAGVQTWMDSNTPTVIMPLATPQTISLPSVTLPTLPVPTVNVWADAESSGTGYAMGPDAEMEYERDVTIAFDKLQAQVSATTVREATNG